MWKSCGASGLMTEVAVTSFPNNSGREMVCPAQTNEISAEQVSANDTCRFANHAKDFMCDHNKCSAFLSQAPYCKGRRFLAGNCFGRTRENRRILVSEISTRDSRKWSASSVVPIHRIFSTLR